MPMDRFLIAPFDENSGLTTNMRPWQIPDSAWAQLDNAYIFRGRLRKRFGSRYMSATEDNMLSMLQSRLRIQVGTISSPSSPVPGNVFQPGQMFSAGSQVFTVYQTGTPASMLATGPGTGTYNTSTGAFVLSGTGLSGSTPIYFYAATPVTGLAQYEFGPVNNFKSFGFDTQFAYVFGASGWSLSTGSPTWHGPDNNLFWAYNWQGLNAALTSLVRSLFVSNFYVANPNGPGTATDDPIYYYNNSTWTSFTPYFAPAGGAPGTGPFVQTALIILPFHGRLLLLNTIENDGTSSYGNNTQYVNRVRYSFVGSPFWANSFYQVNQSDNAGIPNQSQGTNAGFQDAATLEAIISAKFIKDRLIVYFEESTWELVFTGNEQQPFEWQKLNDELGSMATFSTVGFDKALLTIGDTGVHSCNGSNVVRIDQKIPDQIFQVADQSNEVDRICSIRDYYSEMVYWAIPDANYNNPVQPYPSRVLVYNYENKTWAFNDDCITAFGYFDGQPSLTWADINWPWYQWNEPWNAGSLETNVRQVIAGNQQGFTFVIDVDQPRNEGVLQISNIVQESTGIQLTIYNHMLKYSDYIHIENIPAGVTLNGKNIYTVTYIDQNTVIASYPPALDLLATITGTYSGGATAARVSNYDIYSKQWNPYDKDGRNVYVAKIDFAVERTYNGQVTIDYSPSSSVISTISDAEDTNSVIGTSILETSPYPQNLYPLEQTQNRLWHPLYFQTDGECIQINIYMSPQQMCDPTISLENFQLEGLVLHTQPVSYRLQ